MDQTHPDPFQDALSHGVQRAIEITSCAVTAAQVYAYQQRTQARGVGERDARARRALNAQSRAERDAARAGWAPALDPQWLRQADLMDTARAWGAAMPYADRDVPWYEPSAATAMRKAEERLRQQHLYAMARYDRLRGEGLRPAEAMAEAAPLFARPPHARDAPMAPRPALGAGDGTGISWTVGRPAAGPPQPGTDAAGLERRGRQILAALQDRARRQGRGLLGEDEQRTVLETVTDLPPEIIDRIVQPTATSAAGTPTRTATTRSARPWENDFPMPIHDVVVTAAHDTPVPASAAARSQPTRQTGRHVRQRA